VRCILSRHRKPGDSWPLPLPAEDGSPDIPSGHGFEQGELFGHETQSNVHAAKQRNYPVGVFLLKVVVNIKKRIPISFIHISSTGGRLELQLVRVAEILEILLAGKKRLVFK